MNKAAFLFLILIPSILHCSEDESLIELDTVDTESVESQKKIESNLNDAFENYLILNDESISHGSHRSNEPTRPHLSKTFCLMTFLVIPFTVGLCMDNMQIAFLSNPQTAYELTAHPWNTTGFTIGEAGECCCGGRLGLALCTCCKEDFGVTEPDDNCFNLIERDGCVLTVRQEKKVVSDVPKYLGPTSIATRIIGACSSLLLAPCITRYIYDLKIIGSPL